MGIPNNQNNSDNESVELLSSSKQGDKAVNQLEKLYNFGSYSKGLKNSKKDFWYSPNQKRKLFRGWYGRYVSGGETKSFEFLEQQAIDKAKEKQLLLAHYYADIDAEKTQKITDNLQLEGLVYDDVENIRLEKLAYKFALLSDTNTIGVAVKEGQKASPIQLFMKLVRSPHVSDNHKIHLSRFFYKLITHPRLSDKDKSIVKDEFEKLITLITKQNSQRDEGDFAQQMNELVDNIATAVPLISDRPTFLSRLLRPFIKLSYTPYHVGDLLKQMIEDLEGIELKKALSTNDEDENDPKDTKPQITKDSLKKVVDDQMDAEKKWKSRAIWVAAGIALSSGILTGYATFAALSTINWLVIAITLAGMGANWLIFRFYIPEVYVSLAVKDRYAGLNWWQKLGTRWNFIFGLANGLLYFAITLTSTNLLLVSLTTGVTGLTISNAVAAAFMPWTYPGVLPYVGVMFFVASLLLATVTFAAEMPLVMKDLSDFLRNDGVKDIKDFFSSKYSNLTGKNDVKESYRSRATKAVSGALAPAMGILLALVTGGSLVATIGAFYLSVSSLPLWATVAMGIGLVAATTMFLAELPLYIFNSMKVGARASNLVAHLLTTVPALLVVSIYTLFAGKGKHPSRTVAIEEMVDIEFPSWESFKLGFKRFFGLQDNLGYTKATAAVVIGSIITLLTLGTIGFNAYGNGYLAGSGVGTESAPVKSFARSFLALMLPIGIAFGLHASVYIIAIVAATTASAVLGFNCAFPASEAASRDIELKSAMGEPRMTNHYEAMYEKMVTGAEAQYRGTNEDYYHRGNDESEHHDSTWSLFKGIGKDAIDTVTAPFEYVANTTKSMFGMGPKADL